jgi:YD repeat-containing protein
VDFDGDNVEDTGDQVTTYTFGTTKGATAGDSEIGSGHLLQEIEYPDSASASDVVTFAYNAQSQRIYKQDQAGNVLEYDYDDSGRPEHERATTIAADFDDAIKRITQTYDDVGRLEKVTQYDNAAVGSGAVQDEVKYLFDDWWNIRKIRQDNDSAVGASGYYEIIYAYEKQTTGRNTARRSSVTAPSGNVCDFKFRSTGGRHDDDCSRVTQINDGATLLVLYE